jgi:hypothetical protein
LKMMNSCNSKLANNKCSQSSPTVIASSNLHLVSNPALDYWLLLQTCTFRQQPAPKQLQHKRVELNLRKQRQWFLLDVLNSAGGVKIRQQELRIRGLLAFCLHIPRVILLFLRWKSIIRCTTTTCCSDVGTRFWEEAILHIISRFSSLCGPAWQVSKDFLYLLVKLDQKSIYHKLWHVS